MRRLQLLVFGALILLADGIYPLTARAAVNNCLNVEDAISQHMQNMENVKTDYLNKYQATADHLLQLGNNFSLEGLDVKQYEQDRETFNQKVSDFQNSYTDYYNAAQTARSETCDASESDLKNDLATTRSKLAVVQQKAQAVYQQYETVLLPDIRSFNQ